MTFREDVKAMRKSMHMCTFMFVLPSTYTWFTSSVFVLELKMR